VAAPSSETSELAAQAERLRASGALGRSGALVQLFDFLAAASERGERPKEVEIAQAVFGKGGAFDGGQDATVRVYVHRLRKKLDEYYAGSGAAEPVRLEIPKGEYRIVAAPRAGAADPAPARRLPRWSLLLAGLLALNLLAWAGWWATHRDGEVGDVRRSAPWASLLGRERPLLVVVGDYYIFGDIDEATGSGRLIREYSVNSAEDLDRFVMDKPETLGRYRDLDLSYLPVGAAYALAEVLPVLAPKAAHVDQLRVVAASDLTPEMLKRNDILYVGYLSGLGVLRAPVFAGSRFRVGDTWDQLVDSRTGRTYESQEGGPGQRQGSQRDLGYFASFPGPQGNRIVVLAGARDTGLMQTAEAVTSPQALKAMRKAADGGVAFEALYEAEGLRRANIGGRLVLTAPLAVERIWAPAAVRPAFPAG